MDSLYTQGSLSTSKFFIFKNCLEYGQGWGWLATHLDGVLVGLQDDIEFETLVLRPVDGLLVLGLARGHELGIF